MSDKFWCNGCGTKLDVLDAVAEIKDGAGLCGPCNQQLEREQGRGVREYIPKRRIRV